jgi:hypothetical protein
MKTIKITALVGLAATAGLTAWTPAACAFDAGKPAAQNAIEPAAAFTLPIYLDSDRLADLQSAWRARPGFNEAAVPVVDKTTQVEVINAVINTDEIVRARPKVEKAVAVPPLQPAVAQPAAVDVIHAQLQAEEAAMQSAQVAITRAERVSRETASVRERAEELSRRFLVAASGGTTITAPLDPKIDFSARTSLGGPAPAETPAAVAPAVLVSADTDAVIDTEVPAASVAEPVPSVEAEVQSAAVTDAPVEKAVAKPKPTKRTAAARAPVKPAKPAATVAAVAEPAAPEKPAVENSGIPTEFSAFGWNSQPNGERFGAQ